MATVVRMPAVMAGATEAALQSWLVAVGDAVEAGQAIAEIETEKAVFEQETDASGTVAALLVAPGDAVPVGAPIAVLAAAGETAAEALAVAGVGSSTGTAGVAPAAVGVPTAGPDAGSAVEPAPRSESAAASSPRLFASPLVRRLARERGLDLAALRGSGPQGRIVRRDLDGVPAASVSSAPPAAPAAPEPPVVGPDGWTDQPHTPMRRAIARRLTESVTTIPHFALVADCRVDALLDLRRAVNETREQSVSINDLVVKAAAAAFVAVPAANAIWTDDALRRFAHADIGVAIAVEGGLVTPVVRGVDRLPLGELSDALRDLADRARAGRLRQSELEGGSFAVSNLGMFGTREFTAIINPPHSGILAVGAIERRAVVGDDGTLVAASVLTVTLSADHRVLDGALAARWLAAFRRILEHPVSMIV